MFNLSKEPSKIKVEHYLNIMEKDSGFIKVSNSIYILIPSEIAQKLRQEAGLDLKRDRSQITPQCTLLADNHEPLLQFRFSRIQKMPQTERR